LMDFHPRPSDIRCIAKEWEPAIFNKHITKAFPDSSVEFMAFLC
jgi:hypothetical protein